MLSRPFHHVVFTAFLAVACLYGQKKPAEPKLKEIKPGWNLFSKEQDIKMGQEYSQQIAQQMEVLPAGPLTEYIQALGRKIATQPQANGFPYEFRVVNDPSINAFALPGGPVFIHTGILLNADNEGQLIGVIAHEVSHIALRHSTNSVTKSYALQIPAMIAGVYGEMKGGITGMLTQLGVGLGANGLLMKFSRGHEQQADLLGARMMNNVGYNPIEIARFFEKLEAASGKGGMDFFSSHPNPGNRVKYVSDEVLLLPRREYNGDSGQFEKMKALAKSLPAPKKKPQATGEGQVPNQPPQNSDGTRTWTGDGFTVKYPGEWLGLGEPKSPAVTIAPRAGLKKDPKGQVAVGLGVMVSHYEDDDREFNFRTDTENLIRRIMKENPSMGNQRPQINQNQINGRNIYVTRLTSESPLDGGTEVDTIVTMEHRGGMLYLVFIAPEREMANQQRNFDAILSSLSLAN
jgi:beta-barrel assembly-enhancing protease